MDRRVRTARPDVGEPADFDAFWADTISSHTVAIEPTITRLPSARRSVEVYDVTFAGYDGHPIGAWLLLPASRVGPIPGLVSFVGYGGGRGLPHEHLAWPSAGYAYLVMDTRGQGSKWGSGGTTADPAGAGPSVDGFLTRGIERPEDYYYRRVMVDAVRAVEFFRALPDVDPARVGVTGGSQGGGIAIAAAALVDGLVAAMPDVPFLCQFERALDLAEAGPYREIVTYLAVHRGTEAQVFRTLSYFDGVNLAKRAHCPALFSVAHRDLTCPPETVLAARDRWAGDVETVEYPYNDHEGGGAHQWLRQVDWFGRIVRRDS
jgi:cephalosporin-C deacetylase